MAFNKEFIPLVPPQESRPKAAWYGKAAFSTFVRDNFTITTWLCLGAVVQGTLFIVGGRVALLPALTVLLYRTGLAYAQTMGWLHNPYMDGVVMKKFSAQFPDQQGNYGNKPADTDVVVFLIGARCNHPMGMFAPGFKELGDYFPKMMDNLEENAEEYGFLGMTSWLNSSARSTNNENLQVGYFKTVEGLHKFAHSDLHREGWNWWNKTIKQHPHLSIYHETYHVPKGHWETIYAQSHLSGINSTTSKYTDKESGKAMWASPTVDASKGLLKTSAGRMSRSNADEHDKYGEDPW